METLAYRLRSYRLVGQPTQISFINPDGPEAADRIGTLETALRECIAARGEWIGSTTDEGDAAASQRLDRAHKAARAALSGPPSNGIVGGRAADARDHAANEKSMGAGEDFVK